MPIAGAAFTGVLLLREGEEGGGAIGNVFCAPARSAGVSGARGEFPVVRTAGGGVPIGDEGFCLVAAGLLPGRALPDLVSAGADAGAAFGTTNVTVVAGRLLAAVARSATASRVAEESAEGFAAGGVTAGEPGGFSGVTRDSSRVVGVAGLSEVGAAFNEAGESDWPDAGGDELTGLESDPAELVGGGVTAGVVVGVDETESGDEAPDGGVAGLPGAGAEAAVLAEALPVGLAAGPEVKGADAAAFFVGAGSADAVLPMACEFAGDVGVVVFAAPAPVPVLFAGVALEDGVAAGAVSLAIGGCCAAGTVVGGRIRELPCQFNQTVRPVVPSKSRRSSASSR